jgi:hypothetical protein
MPQEATGANEYASMSGENGLPGRLWARISFVYLGVLGDLKFRTEDHLDDIYLSSILT